MKAAPDVQFSGQSLRTLDDESLMQLLLRDDLPPYLNNLYNVEADRRMGKITPALFVTAPLDDQEAVAR
jgi:hypothetical protein